MYDVKDTEEFKRIEFMAYLNEIDRRQKELFWKTKLLPKQQELYDSTARVTLYIGGNRSGKTFAGAYSFSQFMCREHRAWKPAHDKPLRGWVVGLDTVNLLEPIIIPQLEETMPERYFSSKNKKDRIWKFHDKSMMQFKTSEASGGSKKFQSDNVDVIWIDEECPEEIFKECLMRIIDRNGRIIMTMTPTQGMSWSYERLYKPGIEGRKIDDIGDIKVIQVDTSDNHHLPANALASITAMLKTPEEREMRLHGKYVLTGGSKIFSFDILKNVRKNIVNKYVEGDIFLGADGGPHFLTDVTNPALKVWEAPRKGCNYFLGVDSSEGITDPTAVIISREEHGKLIQVAEYVKVIPPEDQSTIVVALGRWYNTGFINIERNSAGLVIISDITGDDMYPDIALYLREKDDGDLNGQITSVQIGTHTDAYSKARMISNLRGAIRDDKYVIRSEESLKEMDAYVEDKHGKIRAAYGHDDRVCAHFILEEGFKSSQSVIVAPHQIKRKEVHRYGEETNSTDSWFTH